MTGAVSTKLILVMQVSHCAVEAKCWDGLGAPEVHEANATVKGTWSGLDLTASKGAGSPSTNQKSRDNPS